MYNKDADPDPGLLDGRIRVNSIWIRNLSFYLSILSKYTIVSRILEYIYNFKFFTQFYIPVHVMYRVYSVHCF